MKDERKQPPNTDRLFIFFPFRTHSDRVTYPDLDDGNKGNPIVRKRDR